KLERIGNVGVKIVPFVADHVDFLEGVSVPDQHPRVLISIRSAIEEHGQTGNKVRIVPCGNQLPAGGNKTERVVKVLPPALRSNRIMGNRLDQRSILFHPLQPALPGSLILAGAIGGMDFQYLMVGETSGIAFHPGLRVDLPQLLNIALSETSSAAVQLPAIGEFE